MSGVDLLTRFFTAYKFTLPLDQVRDDPSLSVLSDLGIVKYRQEGATVLCDSCDFPHSVKIGIDPITDKLGWRCSDAGFVEAKADQLKKARLSPDLLAEQIASTLRCGRRKNTPLIENLLWNIGRYELQGNDVNVYLTSRIRDADDADAIANVLYAVPGLRNGLVVTPDLSGSAGLTIAGCHFTALADVISIGGDGLGCDQSSVARLAGVAVKAGPGRLKQEMRGCVADTIRQLHKDGKTFRSKRMAVKAIQAALKARYHGSTPPGRTVIEDEIDNSEVGCFLVGN